MFKSSNSGAVAHIFAQLAFLSFSGAETLHDYDPELLEKTLQDERCQAKTVYTSKLGQTIAIITGSTSAVSSLLIVYLIIISRRGITSIYHRIMLCLSIFDFLSSMAIAFTTIPMPKDMIYDQFEGIVLGNTGTCNAQGFSFILGTACASLYNCFLLVYYLLTIRYRKSEMYISRCIEPLMHALTLVYGFSLSFALLAFDAYNPTPLDVWCTAITYPWWCPGEEGPCLLRTKKESYIVRHIMAVSFPLIAFVMIWSLSAIIWTIYTQERLYLKYRELWGKDRMQVEEIDLNLRVTKVILKQAFAYFLAYASVNIFPIVTVIAGKSTSLSSRVFPILHLLIRPLQGFFNLMIFILHKQHNIRRNRTDISFLDAVRKMFRAEEEPEHVISTLYLVRRDEEHKETNEREIIVVGVPNVPPSTALNFRSGNTEGDKKSVNHGELAVNVTSQEVSSKTDSKNLSGFSGSLIADDMSGASEETKGEGNGNDGNTAFENKPAMKGKSVMNVLLQNESESFADDADISFGSTNGKSSNSKLSFLSGSIFGY